MTTEFKQQFSRVSIVIATVLLNRRIAGSGKMKRSFFICLLTAVFIAANLSGCRHDPLTPLADAPIMSFNSDVQPIFISSCTQSGCHGQNGRLFALVTYDDIVRRVSAGKPHSSKIYSVITANAIGVMPPKPNPHLTDTELKTIYLWIAQGALNN